MFPKFFLSHSMKCVPRSTQVPLQLLLKLFGLLGRALLSPFSDLVASAWTMDPENLCMLFKVKKEFTLTVNDYEVDCGRSFVLCADGCRWRQMQMWDVLRPKAKAGQQLELTKMFFELKNKEFTS